MLRILADHDVEGHVQALIRVCSGPEWGEIWESLACKVDSFEGLGLPHETADAEVWRLCQERGIVLITGNGNAEGPTSLEMAIRNLGSDKSLPVITISDPKRLLRDRDYAQAATARLLQDLIDLDTLRGTGRLFIP
jgi:Tfp pilus assembly ATPase PilU